MKYSCHSRYASFKCALSGFKQLVKEPNFRIHIVIAVITTVLGILCRLSVIEWCGIIICFGLVMAAEGLNTAIEILADRVCPCKDESIKRAKDVAACAVLLASLAAMTVGTLIFAGKVIANVTGWIGLCFAL